MPKITGPWSYWTPYQTTDYPEGSHDVSAEIAAAYQAEMAKNKELSNGDQSAAKTGTQGDPGAT